MPGPLGQAWAQLLRGAGVRTERLIVGQPAYHRALAEQRIEIL